MHLHLKFVEQTVYSVDVTFLFPETLRVAFSLLMSLKTRHCVALLFKNSNKIVLGQKVGETLILSGCHPLQIGVQTSITGFV